MGMKNLAAKCRVKMNSLWNKVKSSAGNMKQEDRIAEAEKTVARMTAEIGNLAVISLDGGADLGESIGERYELIKEARAVIEAANSEKEKTAAVCPHCGKKTLPGMRYCGYCGEKL